MSKTLDSTFNRSQIAAKALPPHKIRVESKQHLQQQEASHTPASQDCRRKNSRSSRPSSSGSSSGANTSSERYNSRDETALRCNSSSPTRAPTTSPITADSPYSQTKQDVEMRDEAKQQKLNPSSPSNMDDLEETEGQSMEDVHDERTALAATALSSLAGRPNPPHTITGGAAQTRAPTQTGSYHSRGVSGDSSTSNICLCQPDPKIPRPRNAFILYRQHHQAAITSRNPSLSNPEISKVLGEQWKSEPPEVKKDWKNLAEEEKHRHQQQYPEYRYQPKRTRRSSTVDGAATSLPQICPKCGNRTMISPAAPQTSITQPLPASSSGAVAASNVSATAPPSSYTSITAPVTTSHNYDPPNSNKLRPLLPPPQSIAAGMAVSSTQRVLPPMKSLSLSGSSSHPARKPSRNYPPNVGVGPQPSFRDYAEEGRYGETSPDPKRRRFFSNGYSTSPTNASRLPLGNPYHLASPYRESFPHPQEDPGRFSHPPAVGSMPPPSARSQSISYFPNSHHDSSLTLPPIKDTGDARKSVEALVMGIPFLGKIRILGRISPPYKTPMGQGQPIGRGTILAVEGDDNQAVSELSTWLGQYLAGTEGHQVRMADGPAPPQEGKPVAINDYYHLISEWHRRSREMIAYVIGAPLRDNRRSVEVEEKAQAEKVRRRAYRRNSADTDMTIEDDEIRSNSHSSSRDKDMADEEAVSPKNTHFARASRSAESSDQHPPPREPSWDPNRKPILLLNRYQLHASNSFASRIPITDAYSPVDHWQWMATLWRDIAGPDLLIYLRTVTSAEEMANQKPIEVREDLRAVIVRRERDAHIEDKNLRRLAFEVGEWIRSIANGEDRGGNAQAQAHQPPLLSAQSGTAPVTSRH